MSRTRRILLALAFALVGLQHAAFAAGIPVLPVAPQSDSKNAGMGIDGMVKTPDLRGGNQPMLFEKYALLDYDPLNIDIGSSAIGLVTNPSNETINTFGNMVADVEAVILLALATVTTRSVEWALSLDLISALGGSIATVVNGLHQHFYNLMEPIALAAVGFVLLWAIALSRVMRAVGAIAWAVLALVIGGILMADPVRYTSDVQGFTNWTSQQALTGIGSVDVGAGNRDATTSQGSVQNAEMRAFANRAWYLWAYAPWTVLEFGQVDPKVPGTDHQLGVELLDKNSGRGGNFDSDIKQMPQSVQDWFHGDKGIQRAGVGLFALGVGFAATILTLTLVVKIVKAAIGVLFLVLGSPVVFAVAPMAIIGQLILLKWLEHLIKNFATVVIMGIYLGIVMLLAGLMAAAAASWGWFVMAGLQLVILAWAVWNRNTFLALGHRVAYHRSPATPAPLPQSRPAATADYHLVRAQRQMVRPLRPPRAALNGANGANGARTLPAGQPVAAQATQAATTAGRTARAGQVAATTGRTAVAGTSTAGLYLAGLAAVKTGRAAVRGYHALRHHSQVPLAHFTGGMPARPSLPQYGGRSPSVLWMTQQQIRAAHAAKRLPPPQPTQAPSAKRPPSRTQRPAAQISQKPAIQITKSGARVMPGPKTRTRKRTP